jgi:hypothetical protein
VRVQDDGDRMHLRNVGLLQRYHAALHPRRLSSSETQLILFVWYALYIPGSKVCFIFHLLRKLFFHKSHEYNINWIFIDFVPPHLVWFCDQVGSINPFQHLHFTFGLIIVGKEHHRVTQEFLYRNSSVTCEAMVRMQHD